MTTKTRSDIRYAALYTLADVSRYTHVPLPTLMDWRETGLIVPPDRSGVAPLSFVNLVEAHILRGFRRVHSVPMPRVRSAVRWLSAHYKTRHPLAELDLRTDGYSLFVEHLGRTVSASAGGQIGLPGVIELFLKRIERDTFSAPVRFFPFTTYEQCPTTIVMDPGVEFGRPVIVGTRIATVTILERYSGGESLSDIAQDYDLQLPQVEEALRCEIERRAA